MGKIYAVRKGRKTGLFYSWKECQEQIDGYSGAEYKGFSIKEDAENYLNFNQNSINSQISSKILKAYVDGSFDSNKNIYGSGIVIIKNNELEEFSFSGKDIDLIEMRNVAGEIKASEFAMKYAIENNYNEVNIYYDYEGIEKWCNGAWEAKKIGTLAYKDFYNRIRKHLKVNFVKVKAHTGDIYNEMADKLAKKSINDSNIEDKEQVTNLNDQVYKISKNKNEIILKIKTGDFIISDDNIKNTFKNYWKSKGRKIKEIESVELIFNIEKQDIEWKTLYKGNYESGIIKL